MLARSALESQGHAQGLIEQARKPPPPNLSCDDLVSDIPAHVLSIQEAQPPLHPHLSANPTGTSPTVSRGIVHSPVAPVDFANCRQDPRVQGLSPRPLEPYMTSGPYTHGGPADSLYNVWPLCNFCGRQERNVQSYQIPERQPLLLCLSCYHKVLECQGPHRGPPNPGPSADAGSFAGSMRMDALGSLSRYQGGYREPKDLVDSFLKRMPPLPVKHGMVDHLSSEFLHYRDTIIQLAQELDDLTQFGDPAEGFYLATVLRYIEQNPYVLLKDVPHLQRTRGSAGRCRPDSIMWRVLSYKLGPVYNQIPPGIIAAESAIELFQFFVSLRPRNNQAQPAAR